MDKLESLQGQTITVGIEAVGALNVIAKKITEKILKSTAFTFNDLLEAINNLDEPLINARSPKQKLIIIVKGLDDSIVTLIDFVHEIAETSSHNGEIYKHLTTLLAALTRTHQLCATMKHELDQPATSTSKFTQAALPNMTRTIKVCLKKQGRSLSKSCIIALRNYGIIEEVVTLVNETHRLIYRFLL